METLLHIGHAVALAVEGIAIFLIAVGSIEALINMTRVMVLPGSTQIQKRRVWLEFTRWLVAAMTVQLAGDIVVRVRCFASFVKGEEISQNDTFVCQ